MTDQKVLITNYMVREMELGNWYWKLETGNWKLVYNPIDKRITNCLKA